MLRPENVVHIPVLLAYGASCTIGKGFGDTGAIRCFVPVTEPAIESIVNVASNVSTGPSWKPKRPAPIPVCAPIVSVPSSAKVPGYGPEATPLQWNDWVVVPFGLQLAPRSKSSPLVARSSPWRVGAP